jgi:hypothetical protein
MDTKRTTTRPEPRAYFIVFAVAFAAAQTLTLWWLIHFGAYHLVYLSNWMVIFNNLFYLAVIASQMLRWADRASLLGGPLLLSCDILWSIYTLGLALFGATCFKNSQRSTLYYGAYAVCVAYNHFSPLILIIVFMYYRFRDSVSEWADILERTIGGGDRRSVLHAGVCAFIGTIVWLVVPALPCLIYSAIIDPLGVYGITITLDQLNGILLVAVCAHAVVATICLYYILHYRTRGKFLFEKNK